MIQSASAAQEAQKNEAYRIKCCSDQLRPPPEAVIRHTSYFGWYHWGNSVLEERYWRFTEATRIGLISRPRMSAELPLCAMRVFFCLNGC